MKQKRGFLPHEVRRFSDPHAVRHELRAKRIAIENPLLRHSKAEIATRTTRGNNIRRSA